jgi:GNAT superfamily N-acetyltransferase
MTKRVTLLWHGDKPVGICVFCTPAASLRLRNQYFGLAAPRRLRSLFLKNLNQQLWLLARVVLHPTYRGAGVAAAFVRRSCETCPISWIETLSAMGHLNPFFEKAGFHRVGVIRKDGQGYSRQDYGRMFGNRRGQITEETVRKSRFAEPVYYVFDNRAATNATRPPRPAVCGGGSGHRRQGPDNRWETE